LAAARYLVRFDDICPTMNWSVWARVEAMLRRLELRPILAVVPDNRDPQLVAGPPHAEFWDQVRRWQSWGWTIGLHGSRHVYETRVPGLIGLNARSEFAGVPESRQAEHLDHAIEIFRQQGVRADCWVAPGHSFDSTTVRLLRSRGIMRISDGHFLRPVLWHGCTWLPQQLWRFRSMPFGVWTVCYHHNGFDEAMLHRLESDLLRYRSQIVGFDEALSHEVRPCGLVDRAAAVCWLAALKLKRVEM
jgi:predicted deacetylase